MKENRKILKDAQKIEKDFQLIDYKQLNSEIEE